MSFASFEHYLIRTPDLAHYVKAGLLPDSPDLLAAAAAHNRMTDRVREAQMDRDEALAKQRNAQHADEVALVDAVYSDDPDIDLAAIAGRHQKSADEDVAKARAIVAAFRRPSLQTTHDYVSQLVEKAETVEAHLAPERARREAKVAKARAALAAAEAEAAEVTELIWYFNAANNSITNYTLPTVPAHVRIADGGEQ